MHNRTVPALDEPTMIGKIISWFFGLAVLAAAVINSFWGQPAGFGVFLGLLSLVYFLPLQPIVQKVSGGSFSAMRIARILLALFIIWAVLGVGDLFDKIELMRLDISAI